MRFEPNEPARFGRDSPVLRHWLANSAGFRVKGRHSSGVVDRVYGLPGATTSLAVRRRFRRRLIVPADAVAEVVPEERLLVVRRDSDVSALRRRRRRRIARPVASTTGRFVAAQARGLGRGATVTARYSARGAAASARASGRAAVAGARIGFRIGRDATLSLVELAEVARPHVRRFAVASAREVARAAIRARAAVRDARARRRRQDLSRSLESVVAALGRERAAGNGHVSEPALLERSQKGERTTVL